MKIRVFLIAIFLLMAIPCFGFETGDQVTTPNDKEGEIIAWLALEENKYLLIKYESGKVEIFSEDSIQEAYEYFTISANSTNFNENAITTYTYVCTWKDNIPWDILQPEIKWLAMDYDGRWYGYTKKPFQTLDSWKITYDGSWWSLENVVMPPSAPEDWTKTLAERPE
jgi:hypothetical protein